MCIFPFNVETCHPEICREHLASSWQFSAKTEKYLLALTESDAGQTYKWDVRAKYLCIIQRDDEGLLEMVEVGGASKVWQRAPVLCQLKTTL